LHEVERSNGAAAESATAALVLTSAAVFTSSAASDRERHRGHDRLEDHGTTA
jgi:hypothetical protein